MGDLQQRHLQQGGTTFEDTTILCSDHLGTQVLPGDRDASNLRVGVPRAEPWERERRAHAARLPHAPHHRFSQRGATTPSVVESATTMP
jgi:hypothetical protein